MNLKLNKQKLAALSLAEVLVVLAIAATMLVSIAQLTVNMMVTVKNNEIIDYTTGISLQALEVAKSADDVILTSSSQIIRAEGNYSIDLGQNPAVLFKQSDIIGPSSRITDCNPSSDYFIDVNLTQTFGGLDPNVCMQIIIEEKKSSLNQDYYALEALTITVLGTNKEERSVTGFRRGDFDIR